MKGSWVRIPARSHKTPYFLRSFFIYTPFKRIFVMFTIAMQKSLTSILFLSLFMNSGQLIFDFSRDTDISVWKVVDDVVMGGKSSGKFSINNEGNAVFYGNVSLENNGGFSSVRHQFLKKKINSSTKIKIRLKGDGNAYQLRIKKNQSDYYSYVATFQTNNNWEIIEVNLSEMQPKFRGKSLSLPNFSENSFEEIAFLIGNKKAQDFCLEIDKIYLE